MGRSIGINRARVEPPDAKEIKRTADRYLHAQHFLLRLYSHKNEITADQLHDLRRQAIGGDIEGVLSALGIPYQLVPPNKWKKEFSLIGKDKQASIATCHKLFPDLDLKRTERCKTDSDGKAEATLLACYAMRHFSEGCVE